MGLYDFTFYSLIHRNAESFGDKPAWHEAENGRVLSFREYHLSVDEMAAGLAGAGIRKGDRLGVLGKNSVAFFTLYGAAAALGAIVLPINWRLSADEVVFNLNDCTPVALFVDAEYQDMIAQRRGDIPSARALYNLKDDAGRFTRLADLTPVQGWQPADVASDDGFVIIHTAAVAGRPRGALVSHRNLLMAGMHFMYCFGLTDRHVHLNLLPLFHVAGLFMAVQAFHAGAMNVNMTKFDAGEAAALIQKFRVSVIFEFAPILGSILEAAEKTGVDIGSLQSVMGLDGPDTIRAYQNKTGGTFYCMYGQTETACLSTMGRFDDAPGSAGRVIPMAEVRLVDDYDRPVPAGQKGEIAVRGPMVFKGYWNLDADNAFTFRDGWHHTGDMGRFDENGFLFYAGRKAEKELIKPGGENVYPAEVEKAILQHPDVVQTVVFGVPDPKWKEGIKAVCVRKPGSDLSAPDLIRFVGQTIASFKKPQYVEFVDALPSGPDGLPDRAAVKSRYGGGQG